MRVNEDQFCPIHTGDELASPDFALFYQRWNAARGAARMPNKSCIQAASIPPHILKQVSIIGVENNGRRFVIRLAGSELRERGQIEMTGRSVGSEASTPAELEASPDTLEHLKWCCDNQQPYCVGGAARWSGREMLAQRMIVLPYCGDDGSVERLLTLTKLDVTDDPCRSCEATHCSDDASANTPHPMGPAGNPHLA
ncbi:PAS domain-containing protein [Pyruvatibacter sp.]|uniref:PAS domain-containing protein n=1 Tax=Pyruvatibacter sp. TaxID=1981328 RepID=UPI00326310CA